MQNFELISNLQPSLIKAPSIHQRVAHTILTNFCADNLSFFENTIDADRILRDERRDILFIELGAYPLNGVSFAKRLRFNEKHANTRTPLFLLLEDDPNDDVYDAMEKGYLDGFVIRPFNVTNMYEVLSSHRVLSPHLEKIKDKKSRFM